MELHSEWITGFVDGEGCFHVSITKNEGMKLGYQVLPEFTVTQHERSIQVLHGLKTFFGTGVVRSSQGKSKKILSYKVRNATDLRTIILPFFLKHPLKTSKNVEFLKFRRVLLMMEQGEHLTEEGLLAIQKLKIESNASRNE